MSCAQFSREITLSAIDLTRACAAHELYVPWLSVNASALHGSAGIALYLFTAILAFEQQARQHTDIDPFIARENFADFLMASAPLADVDLDAAARIALRDAQLQEPGFPIDLLIPATHPKFEHLSLRTCR